jgi:DNA-binding NtrC family response regulator
VQATEIRDFSHAAAKKITPMNVLVIDDDPWMRWALAETLRERGWQVSEGGDARETEAAIRKTRAPFDVVLLDYRLPDSDDLSLLASVRTLSPNSKVIMMTAFETPDMVRDALGLGACSVLAKPFDMETVPASLTRVELRQVNDRYRPNFDQSSGAARCP